ncbi:hypothetical protein [Nocardia lasii]
MKTETNSATPSTSPPAAIPATARENTMLRAYVARGIGPVTIL